MTFLLILTIILAILKQKGLVNAPWWLIFGPFVLMFTITVIGTIVFASIFYFDSLL